MTRPPPSELREPPLPPAHARAFVVVAGGVLLVWSLHNALFVPWESQVLEPRLLQPLLLALRAVVWLVPLAYYLARYDPRPPPVAVGLTSRLDVRGLVLGSIPAVVYLLLVGLLQDASGDATSPARSLGAVVWDTRFAIMFLVIVLEEVLMRGFLLRQLVRLVRDRTAQLTVAALFALMHLPAWIALGGVHIGLLPMSISVFLLGLVLGISARASNSILPAIALHLVNNVVAAWLAPG